MPFSKAFTETDEITQAVITKVRDHNEACHGGLMQLNKLTLYGVVIEAYGVVEPLWQWKYSF